MYTSMPAKAYKVANKAFWRSLAPTLGPTICAETTWNGAR